MSILAILTALMPLILKLLDLFINRQRSGKRIEERALKKFAAVDAKWQELRMKAMSLGYKEK